MYKEQASLCWPALFLFPVVVLDDEVFVTPISYLLFNPSRNSRI